VNFTDPTGLLQIEAADRTGRTTSADYINNTYQKEYFDPETKSLRVETKEPSPADITTSNIIKAYDDYMTEHASVSVNAGGGGALTLSQSGSGTDLGGGTVIGAGLSAALTLSGTILPFKNDSKLSFALGGSASLGELPLGVGLDLQWTKEGLGIGLSFSVGIGTKYDAHLNVTDTVAPKNMSEKKGK
jgi:hypothetical protein